MVEPITTVGLVASCAALAKAAAQTITGVREMYKKYTGCEQYLQGLISRIETISTALEIMEDRMQLCEGMGDRAAEALKSALKSCDIVISDIDVHIKRVMPKEDRQGEKLKAKGKIRHIFDEPMINGFQKDLDSQIQALQLFLTVLQL